MNGWFFALSMIMIISLVEMISQYMMKKDRRLVFGVIGYSLIAYILFRTLEYRGMGEVNLMWNVITTIMSAMIGYYYFKERTNRFTYYAILFAIIALYFNYLSEKV